MNVKEFITDYKKANDKERFFDKHVTRTYVGYEEKINSCERIIKHSCFNDKGEFEINTPTRCLLLAITLVQAYLDVEVDMNNVLSEFDLLEEYNIVAQLVEIIPDVQMYRSVLKSMMDDVIRKETSIIRYFDAKIETLNVALNTIWDTVKEVNE